MRLIYFNDEMGRNFGDLLNRPIFDHYLPGFFDGKDDCHFLGIGSILGLRFAKANCRKIVFSSGFAYGKCPTIDESYEVSCVRGPLTASALGLDSGLALADGAYLLHGMMKPLRKKRFDCSLMLHWKNTEKFDWKEVCHEVGINYIDPREDVESILSQLGSSRLVLAEAMHAAIAADALRVPWLPIACYKGINSFKWNDFMQSVHVRRDPELIGSLYTNNDYVGRIVRKKTRGVVDLGAHPWRDAFSGYSLFQNTLKLRSVKKRLSELAGMSGVLSQDDVCHQKYQELKDKLAEIRQNHGPGSSKHQSRLQ